MTPKFDKWSVILGSLVVILFFVGFFMSMVFLRSHQTEYLNNKKTHEPKVIENSGTYYFDEKHKFPYKGDTININSCFELIMDKGKVKSHRIVCVCDCEKYKNK
jgi:hypothetical protein